MKGLFFLAMSPRPNGESNVLNVQTGVISDVIGGTHFKLTFDGSKFNYSRVVPVSALEALSLFNTQAEQQLALAELLGANPEADPTP